jgi:RNA polymerase-binding transcription factor DksA
MTKHLDDHLEATEARLVHLRASVQELRRVTAIATAWLTPGDYSLCEVDGIPIPEVDMDQREIVVMLRAALRDTRDVD